MQTDYSAPDIDTSLAQRRAAEAQENFISFSSIRTVAGSADASFGFGARASRPASGIQGDRYFANNIGSRGGWLYYWTGTAWAIVVGWASGTDAARAALTVTAVDNGAWFNTTDTSKFWEVSGGAWVDRTPAAGTVTSFSAAPTGIFDVATATTTPALSLDNQAANIILAGPGSGGAATPAFRALVTADLPQNAWVSWTPTLVNISVGAGSVTARYAQVSNKTIICRLHIALGAGASVTGDPTFTLPVTRAAYGGTAGLTPLGPVAFRDTGVGAYYGEVINLTTTTCAFRVFDTSGAYALAVSPSSTIPFTWVSGDEIYCQFAYEAA